MAKNYEVTGTRTAFDGKSFQVVVDDIKYAETGKASCREVVVRDAFSMVVAVDPAGSVILVREFRHPSQQAELAFPSTRVLAGEDPEAAARRELSEGAGFKASRMVKLAEINEVPEFARIVGHVFVAEGLEPVDKRDAAVEVEAIKEAELKGMIRRGKVRSVTVMAAWHHFLAYKDRSQLSTHSSEPAKAMGLFHCPALELPNLREVALASLICVAYFWGKRAGRKV